MKNNRTFAKPGLGLALAVLLVLAGCASTAPAPVSGGGGQPTAVATPVAPVVRDTYTVKAGDTLYSIAREQGMDHRELIAMNGIENPNQISVGRVLKIKPKAAAGASGSAVATTAPITTDVVVARPIGNEQVVEKRPLSSNTETFKREPKGGKEPYSDQALAQAQNQGQSKAADPVAPLPVKPEAKPAVSAAAGDETGWLWPASGKVVTPFSEGGNKGVDIDGKVGDPVYAAFDGKILIAKSHNDDSLRRYGNMVIIQHGNGLISVYAHNSKLLVKEGATVSKGQKIAEIGNTGTDQIKLHFEVRSQGKPVDPLKYLPQR